MTVSLIVCLFVWIVGWFVYDCSLDYILDVEDFISNGQVYFQASKDQEYLQTCSKMSAVNSYQPMGF